MTAAPLAEAVVLLTAETRGRAAAAADLAFAGAVLLDLAAAGRVAIEDAALRLLDDAPTWDEAADAALGVVAESPSGTLQDALARLVAEAEPIRIALRDRLFEAGRVPALEDQALWLFTGAPRGPDPAAALRARLATRDPAPGDAALRSLLQAAGLEPGEPAVAG
ncbi:GPP34 family phosphoprotein, partial [Falsiroseomonas oryziterrae]|uniref:GPP34 family phosphoprotein n=1 Tax=Falsiroseomonas oryziterrae TaxID=2911368 RepID=UPI001F020541